MIEVLVCLVVGVSDGDTIKVRCGEPGSYQQVSVRLAEIDAPEKGQPYGQASKRSLSALCQGDYSRIIPGEIDRYGRTVARVSCKGQDASLYQVRGGMAWAFTKYLTDPEIGEAEGSAKSSHVGLWRDAAPVAPWDWRKAQGIGRRG